MLIMDGGYFLGLLINSWVYMADTGNPQKRTNGSQKFRLPCETQRVNGGPCGQEALWPTEDPWCGSGSLCDEGCRRKSTREDLRVPGDLCVTAYGSGTLGPLLTFVQD